MAPRAGLCPSIGLSAPTLPFLADPGTPIPAQHSDQCGLRCQLSHQGLRAHLWPEAKFEVRGQRGPWAQAGEVGGAEAEAATLSEAEGTQTGPGGRPRYAVVSMMPQLRAAMRDTEGLQRHSV